MPLPRTPKGVRLGGRAKGTPNKVTATLKDMVLQSLANVGGTAYLEQQSRDNPTAYLALIGKVLPLQIKEGGTEPVVPTVVRHVYETIEQ